MATAQSLGGVVVAIFLSIGMAGAATGYAVTGGGALGIIGGVAGFILLPAAIIAMQIVFIGLFEGVFPAVFGAAWVGFNAGTSHLLPERIADEIRGAAMFVVLVIAFVSVIGTLPLTLGNVVVAILVANAFTDVAGVATYIVMTVVGFTAMSVGGM